MLLQKSLLLSAPFSYTIRSLPAYFCVSLLNCPVPAGDTRIAADHYPNLVQYVTFMQSQVNSTGVKNLYSHYGEWCPPPATPGGGQGPKPPSPLISSQAYLTDLARVVEIATALGKASDAAYWGAYRASLVTAYNAAFLQPNGFYGNANGDGLQTAQAVSLAIGAVPQASFQSAVDILANDVAVTHGGAWVVGIVGMKQLHSMLVAGGWLMTSDSYSTRRAVDVTKVLLHA